MLLNLISIETKQEYIWKNIHALKTIIHKVEVNRDTYEQMDVNKDRWK